MCSVMELARAYRFEEMILEEIDNCIKRILNYQAEMARIQFYGKLVPEVRDTRRRKRKVINIWNIQHLQPSEMLWIWWRKTVSL